MHLKKKLRRGKPKCTIAPFTCMDVTCAKCYLLLSHGCVCTLPRSGFGGEIPTLRIIGKLGEFQVYWKWVSVEEKHHDQTKWLYQSLMWTGRMRAHLGIKTPELSIPYPNSSVPQSVLFTIS